MGLFDTDDSGALLVPDISEKFDIYLACSDPRVAAIGEQLTASVLSSTVIAKLRAGRFKGTGKTQTNFEETIRRQVELVFLNCINAEGKAIGFSRGKSEYIKRTYSGESHATRTLINVVDAMVELDFLQSYRDKSQSYVSRLILVDESDLDRFVTRYRKELRVLLRSTESAIMLKKRKTIVESGKGGKQRKESCYVRVPYALAKLEPRYDQRAQEIKRYQDRLYGLVISYDGPAYERTTQTSGEELKATYSIRHGDWISSRIKRHFADNLDTPLRFYGAWQELPAHDDDKPGGRQNLRKHILLNGKPTVELDIGCFFPTLLFGLAKIDWRQRFPSGDAYVLSEIDDLISSPSERRQLRDFIKKVFVRFCFDNIHTAKNVLWRLQRDIRNYQKHADSGSVEQAKLPVLGVLARVLKLPVREATEVVVKKYCDLFADIPQNLLDWKKQHADESRITEQVLDACIAADIPCLPIHDGYITTVDCKEQVKEFMLRACHLVTGSRDISIKVIE